MDLVNVSCVSSVRLEQHCSGFPSLHGSRLVCAKREVLYVLGSRRKGVAILLYVLGIVAGYKLPASTNSLVGTRQQPGQ